MKKLTLTTIALAVAVSAFSQGTIAINNRDTNVGGVVAPVYGVIPGSEAVQKTGNTSTGLPAGSQTYTGAPLLSGTGFTFGLLGGPSAASMTFVGSTTYRTGSGAGLTAAGSPTVMIPGVPAGQSATLQVVSWDNLGGTILTWDAALQRKSSGLAQGSSAIFTSRPLGGVDNTGGIVLPPIALYGMESFNLTQVVPEPSTIALGILGGLGTLVLFRRRK